MQLDGVKTNWDLVVVGGGITGAGVFREAVRMGLKTLLCEASDFAWGTSSRSSKLIHGGLRYLKEGKIFLTYDSVKQRERLLREAPGMVEPLGFLMPVYRQRGPKRLSLQAGLSIYDFMAGENHHRAYDSETFSKLVPGISTDGLLGGFRFVDAQVDDARLVLRLINEAVAAGGTAMNYTRAVRINRNRSGAVAGVTLEDTESAQYREISTKAVINATGAWAEKLHPSPKPHLHLRPLRGSHLVFPHWLLPINQAVTLIHPADERPLFIIPWEGALMLGTTDLDHGRELIREPVMAPSEAEYMMAALNAHFPSLNIDLSDAVSSWAGIRPVLSKGDKPPSKESREYIVWEKHGLVTVTGGKLTTFRSLARDALNAAMPYLPAANHIRINEPAFAPVRVKPEFEKRLPPLQLRRLYGRYGRQAEAIIENAGPQDLTRMPGTDTLWAELPILAKNEHIRHLSDLLLRRVRIGLLMPGGGRQHLDRIQGLCAPMLSWNEKKWQAERQWYIKHWDYAYGV
ncbi:MAG: glycerol-3-phosphate dehydrogenase/oxidase [Desulfobacterales bacterium]|nr:glycerol-3-phosphate dehydrogenase/oxidase [Desulfobacterales bacterium]